MLLCYSRWSWGENALLFVSFLRLLSRDWWQRSGYTLSCKLDSHHNFIQQFKLKRKINSFFRKQRYFMRQSKNHLLLVLIILLLEAAIIINNKTPGKNSVETQSYSPGLQLDEAVVLFFSKNFLLCTIMCDKSDVRYIVKC